MKNEYLALKQLEKSDGYAVLCALWMEQVTKIEKARSTAASRGSESAWRFHAGREEGFKLAMTQMDRAIKDMEAQDQEMAGEARFDALIQEIRGGKT